MDSLALLCNLHGDGPATLAGLRKLGCFDLSTVLLLDKVILATLFGESEKVAARFSREARVLADRLGEPVQELEREMNSEVEKPVETELQVEPIESSRDDYAATLDIDEFAPELEATASETLTPFPALSRVDTASAELLGMTPRSEPMLSGPSDPIARTAPKGVVVNAVLEFWSRLDGREPPANFTASSHLRHAPIEGFPQSAAEQLCAAGIETLEEFVEAEILELVSKSDLPYTKLAHLQFLARKALGPNSRPEPVATLSPEPAPSDEGVELTPFGRKEQKEQPILEPESVEEGPAGPFA
jgi:hypothetical protein